MNFNDLNENEKRAVISIAIGVCAYLFGMFLIYLIGSFIALSFDPSEWDPFGRFAYAVFGSLVSAGPAIMLGHFYYEED